MAGKSPSSVGLTVARWILAALSAIASVTLLSLGVFGNWAQREVINTASFTKALVPLGSTPGFQNLIVEEVGNATYDYVLEHPVAQQVGGWAETIDELIGDNALLGGLLGLVGVDPSANLGDLVETTAAQLAEEARQMAMEEAQQFVASAEFTSLLRQIVSSTHHQIIKQLATGSGPITVNIEITPIVDAVTSQLTGIPGLVADFVVPADESFFMFEIEDSSSLRFWYSVLAHGGQAYFYWAVAALVLSLVIAPRRWAVLAGTGVVGAITAAVLLARFTAVPDGLAVEAPPQFLPLISAARTRLTSPLIPPLQTMLIAGVVAAVVGAAGWLITSLLGRSARTGSTAGSTYPATHQASIQVVDESVSQVVSPPQVASQPANPPGYWAPDRTVS